MTQPRRVFLVLLLALFLIASRPAFAAENPPALLVKGLKNPESVTLGWNGQIYVTVIGEFDKDGDGGVMLVKGGRATPLCKGLDDPKGIAFANDALFVADKQRVWRIDEQGKATVFAAAERFPTRPRFLNDVCSDDEGVLYVSDSGDLKGGEGAVFRITQKGDVTVVTNPSKTKGLQCAEWFVQRRPGQIADARFLLRRAATR